MTFQPVLPWPILAVVTGALIFARLVTLRQVLMIARQWRGRAALRWTGVSLAVLLLIAAATRPALPDESGSWHNTGGGREPQRVPRRRPIGRREHRGLSRRCTADRGDAR